MFNRDRQLDNGADSLVIRHFRKQRTIAHDYYYPIKTFDTIIVFE